MFYVVVDASPNIIALFFMLFVATPLWPSVWVKPNTCKVGDLESFGTPECSELNSKAQNTLHWGVLGVIEKVLKRRYRKWPRIGHLDIYSPSYGQKKGHESNWQFDSRPLKVGKRLLSDIRFESATWRWKGLDEGYGSNLIAIGLYSRELWPSKVPKVPLGQFRDSISGVTPLLCPSVGVKPNTWKSWDSESSGTPECLELDSKGQKTLHWGVPGVIEKVLKRRYRKWLRIGNSDICSPSYGQKKGQESNCQFDSHH